MPSHLFGLAAATSAASNFAFASFSAFTSGQSLTVWVLSPQRLHPVYSADPGTCVRCFLR